MAEFLSLRDTVQEKSVKALKDENAKLNEDITRLKELVKLQGKLTYGKMFSESYIENAARNLKKIADADGKTRELSDLLRKKNPWIRRYRSDVRLREKKFLGSSLAINLGMRCFSFAWESITAPCGFTHLPAIVFCWR